MPALKPAERDGVPRESSGPVSHVKAPRFLSRKFLLVSFLVLNALVWVGLLLLWR